MTVAEAIHEFLAELQKDTESRARMKYPWQTAYENAIFEADPANDPHKLRLLKPSCMPVRLPWSAIQMLSRSGRRCRPQ